VNGPSAPANRQDLDQVAEVISHTNEQLGGVEVLVNNAVVVWPLGPSISVGPKEWATAISVNVVANAALSFAVLPTTVERERGCGWFLVGGACVSQWV
jgi:NADP-dependent 3-hydroxy acid dehydrogenase YdfG